MKSLGQHTSTNTTKHTTHTHNKQTTRTTKTHTTADKHSKTTGHTQTQANYTSANTPGTTHNSHNTHTTTHTTHNTHTHTTQEAGQKTQNQKRGLKEENWARTNKNHEGNWITNDLSREHSLGKLRSVGRLVSLFLKLPVSSANF